MVRRESRPAVQGSSSVGCPPPEMRQADQPSPVAHGCQPHHSRQDPVIPHPPPRPLLRLAHWCWHRKATFQRPPATLCQPRILGRTGEWGLLGDAQDRSVRVRVVSGRIVGRARVRTPVHRTWEKPGQRQGRPPTQPPGTVHLWLAHPHCNRSLGGVTVQRTKWGTRLRAVSQAWCS